MSCFKYNDRELLINFFQESSGVFYSKEDITKLVIHGLDALREYLVDGQEFKHDRGFLSSLNKTLRKDDYLKPTLSKFFLLNSRESHIKNRKEFIQAFRLRLNTLLIELQAHQDPFYATAHDAATRNQLALFQDLFEKDAINLDPTISMLIYNNLIEDIVNTCPDEIAFNFLTVFFKSKPKPSLNRRLNIMPLEIAAYKGKLATLKLLLNHYLYLQPYINKLLLAASQGLGEADENNTPIIIYLIENYRCNLNSFDDSKHTPLMYAVKFAKLEAVVYLLSQGAYLHLQRKEYSLFYATALSDAYIKWLESTERSYAPDQEIELYSRQQVLITLLRTLKNILFIECRQQGEYPIESRLDEFVGKFSGKSRNNNNSTLQKLLKEQCLEPACLDYFQTQKSILNAYCKEYQPVTLVEDCKNIILEYLSPQPEARSGNKQQLQMR